MKKKYLFAFKQTLDPPDEDGDVQAGWNISARRIEYGACGYGLFFAVLHEMGHCLNGDNDGRSVLWIFGIKNEKEERRIRNEEKAAWQTASLYCPECDLKEFVKFANRCMAAYGIDPVNLRTVRQWRKDQ